MVYKSIIRMYDERKRKLESLVSDDGPELSGERVQQIKGAIDEIDMFLLTLRQHQDQQVHRNFSYTPELSRQQKSFFGRVFSREKPSTKQFAMSEAMSR